MKRCKLLVRLPGSAGKWAISSKEVQVLSRIDQTISTNRRDHRGQRQTKVEMLRDLRYFPLGSSSINPTALLHRINKEAVERRRPILKYCLEIKLVSRTKTRRKKTSTLMSTTRLLRSTRFRKTAPFSVAPLTIIFLRVVATIDNFLPSFRHIVNKI